MSVACPSEHPLAQTAWWERLRARLEGAAPHAENPAQASAPDASASPPAELPATWYLT